MWKTFPLWVESVLPTGRVRPWFIYENMTIEFWTWGPD